MNLYQPILAQSAAPAAKTTVVQTAPSAGPAQPQPSLGDGILGFAPALILIAVMFYLMYRGQKKEQKRRQEMIDSIRKGSDVITAGGIHGKIIEVTDAAFILEIAENVKITVSKSAVSSVKGAQGDAVKK